MEAVTKEGTMQVAREALVHGELGRLLLQRLPGSCRSRLKWFSAVSDCELCRRTIHRALQRAHASQSDAVEGILHHLASLNCDGARELRRSEAARTLATFESEDARAETDAGCGAAAGCPGGVRDGARACLVPR